MIRRRRSREVSFRLECDHCPETLMVSAEAPTRREALRSATESGTMLLVLHYRVQHAEKALERA